MNFCCTKTLSCSFIQKPRLGLEETFYYSLCLILTKKCVFCKISGTRLPVIDQQQQHMKVVYFDVSSRSSFSGHFESGTLPIFEFPKHSNQDLQDPTICSLQFSSCGSDNLKTTTVLRQSPAAKIYRS